jgi:hypothetical protein
MLLLDTTGSMLLDTSEADPTPRNDTVLAALKLLVPRLSELDAEAEHEEGGGGLRTVTFANGEAHDIEDINPDNMDKKWREIK